MPELLVNLDVDDLEKGLTFYREGLGFREGRRFDRFAVELVGAAAPVYLLVKRPGTHPFPGAVAARDYQPHWTPVHLDLAVPDIEAAVARARAAGARSEGEISEHGWGRMAMMRDPFGHGFCLLQWRGRGYDEIATPAPPDAGPTEPRRNIEAKYRARDLADLERRALTLGARLVGELVQEDHFFTASDGARLKLRLAGNGGELISYRRSDRAEARGSDYRLFATGNPQELRLALEHALGAGPVVKKRRRLLLLDHTRIHLDEVEGLGAFAELETVITTQPEAAARQELSRIAAALALTTTDVVAEAYADILPR